LREDHQLLNRYQTRSRGMKKILLILPLERRSSVVEEVPDQNQGQEDYIVHPCHLREDHQLLKRYQTRTRGRKMIFLIITVWEPFKKSSF
jgi:hypothetical protein